MQARHWQLKCQREILSKIAKVGRQQQAQPGRNRTELDIGFLHSLLSSLVEIQRQTRFIQLYPLSSRYS